MKFIYLFLITITLFTPAIALAIPGYACNSCNEAGYKATATNTQSAGVKYVYDLYNNQVRKYQVTREDIAPGQWTYLAWSLPVEQQVVSGIEIISDFYHETNGTMKATVEVDAAGAIAGMSGWELYPGAAQNNLIDWLSSPGQWPASHIIPFVTGYVTDGLHQIALFFDFNVAQVLTTKVNFEDGSSVVVNFDVINRDFSVDQSSIRDSQNNRIPFSPSDINGGGWSYHGGGTDLQRALDRFAEMGVSIYGSGSGFRWACVCTSGCTCHRY